MTKTAAETAVDVTPFKPVDKVNNFLAGLSKDPTARDALIGALIGGTALGGAKLLSGRDPDESVFSAYALPTAYGAGLGALGGAGLSYGGRALNTEVTPFGMPEEPKRGRLEGLARWSSQEFLDHAPRVLGYGGAAAVMRGPINRALTADSIWRQARRVRKNKLLPSSDVGRVQHILHSLAGKRKLDATGHRVTRGGTAKNFIAAMLLAGAGELVNAGWESPKFT